MTARKPGSSLRRGPAVLLLGIVGGSCRLLELARFSRNYGWHVQLRVAELQEMTELAFRVAGSAGLCVRVARVSPSVDSPRALAVVVPLQDPPPIDAG
jgi:hypothetical protein